MGIPKTLSIHDNRTYKALVTEQDVYYLMLENRFGATPSNADYDVYEWYLASDCPVVGNKNRPTPNGSLGSYSHNGVITQWSSHGQVRVKKIEDGTVHIEALS